MLNRPDTESTIRALLCCGADQPTLNRHARQLIPPRLRIVLWLIFGVLCIQPLHALANPTVPQGGSGSFGYLSAAPPAITGWTIKLNGTTMGSTAAPNGWTAAFNGSQFTVTAPNSNTYAPVATGYQIAYGFMGMVTMNATFDVISSTGIQLSSITLSPTSVQGGQSVTGTATLSAVAPAGGASVTLSSSNTSAATTPATVTIPAGQASATFTVTTKAVSVSTSVTISGTYGGGNASAALIVTPGSPAPPTVTGLSLSPNPVNGGQNVTGTVNLSAAAPAGGVVVTLTVSGAYANAVQFSSTVTVPAGSTYASFPIVTSTVNYSGTVTFTAAANSSSQQSSLTINPIWLWVTDASRAGVTLKWNVSTTGNYLLKGPGLNVTVNNGTNTYTQTPPPAFNAALPVVYQIYDTNFPNAPLSAIEVYLAEGDALYNQTVDSRIDPRYGNMPPFLNFNFGHLIYRGGLFAGFANDPSRIGRSFATLPAPTAPTVGGYTTPDFCAGSINAYFNGCYAALNQTVQMNLNCQFLPAGAGDVTPLVWTTAPAVPPTPVHTAAINYTANSGFTPYWLDWPVTGDLVNNVGGSSSTLSVIWTSSNETASAWAFLAKKEYGDAPCLTSAWTYAIPISLSFTPNPVKGGTNVTATLNVTGVGPGDGVWMYLSSAPNPPQRVTFPVQTGTQIPATYVTGFSRTFTIGTSPVSVITPITITATCNGVSASAVLTLTP